MDPVLKENAVNVVWSVPKDLLVDLAILDPKVLVVTMENLIRSMDQLDHQDLLDLKDPKDHRDPPDQTVNLDLKDLQVTLEMPETQDQTANLEDQDLKEPRVPPAHQAVATIVHHRVQLQDINQIFIRYSILIINTIVNLDFVYKNVFFV